MPREDSQNNTGRLLAGAKERFSNIVPEDFQIIPTLSRVPNQIRRKVREHEGSSFLTMFPVMAVLVSLLSLIHI